MNDCKDKVVMPQNKGVMMGTTLQYTTIISNMLQGCSLELNTPHSIIVTNHLVRVTMRVQQVQSLFPVVC